MRFISYIRVSTDKQGSRGLGVEAQRDAVRAFIGSGELVAEYIEVESGRRDDRPQITAAIEHARKKKAKLVIAKLDRLARDVHFISGLMKSDVPFIAVDRPDAKPFELHIYAAMAEEEARMISERTTRALAVKRAQLAAEGGRLGNPRPGASLAKGMATRVAKADAGKAEVRTIIETIKASGTTTLKGIAAALNERKISTPRGGQWTATQVSRVML